jgi:hypothetical protein
MSGAETAENVETRTGESAASGNLEVQVWREDALGASARLGKGSSLPPGAGGSGRGAVSALSWTAGAASGESAAGCGEVGLSWAIGANRSPAEASSTSRWARGRSNRASSLASTGGVGGGPRVDVRVALTLDERSIGTRCTTGSIGTRVTVDVSVDSFAPMEASLGSLPLWGRVGRGSSIADRCTPWSGTCLIGAPRPIRRD